MNTSRINDTLRTALDDLRAERDRIELAITKLEELVGTNGSTPRGRATGRREGWTPAARRAAAERMRRYWSTRKKGGGAQKGAQRKAARRKWSSAARKAAADRMRKYWADRRKSAAS